MVAGHVNSIPGHVSPTENSLEPAATATASWAKRLGGYASRALKLSLVGAVIAPAVWLIVDEFVWTTSRDAIVVAGTVTLRAPIPGNLRVGVLSMGDVLHNQQIVAKVENPRVDDSRSAELGSRLRSTEAQIEAAQGTTVRLQTFLNELKVRGNKYSHFRGAKMAALLEGARSQVDASRSVELESAERLTRARELLQQGLATQEMLAEREREHTVAAAAAASARHGLDALAVERESMHSGVTLDAYSDQPYSLQRVDEVALSLMRAKATLDEETKQKLALEKQLDEENQRLNLLRTATIAVPGEGRVWRVMASNGEYVNAGQPIVELVQCSRLSVVAELSPRKYARVQLGTRAKFRPKNRGGVYYGVVTQKLVNATSAADAVATQVFKVAVSFPSLAAQLSATCDVGVLGEVDFDP